MELKYAQCYASIHVGPRPEGDNSLLPSIAISTPKKEAIETPANTVLQQQIDRDLPAPSFNMSATSTETVFNTPRANMLDETIFFTPTLTTQEVRRDAFRTPRNVSVFEEDFYQTPENAQIPRGK